MKSCIFAFIGSENIGDEAIFQCLCKEIKGTKNVLSYNPNKTKKLVKGIKVYNSKSIIDNIKAIRNSDRLVIGGGGLIQDQSSIYSIWRFMSRALLGLLLKKKLIFYGISAEPLHFRINKFLVRFVMNRSTSIMVRDKESIKTLKDIGVTINIDYGYDLAEKLEPIDGSFLLTKYGIDRNKKKLGVCLRHWFDTFPLIPVSIANKYDLKTKNDKREELRFLSNMGDVLDFYRIHREYQIVFIPFWRSRDNKIHREVMHFMGKEDVFIVDKDLTPAEISGLINEMDIVIGMRLHSLIFAINNNTPFVAINYADKIKNYLYDKYGKSSEKMLISPYKLCSDELIEKVFDEN